MYPILCIQCTQFFKWCTQFVYFNIYNFSKNAHNSVHSTHNFSKKVSNFVHSTYMFFSKNVHNNSIHSMYIIFQRMYPILYIYIHHFSNNVHNFTYLTYTIFQKMHRILFIQSMQFFKTKKKGTQFCIFNVHIFSKIYIILYI